MFGHGETLHTILRAAKVVRYFAYSVLSACSGGLTPRKNLGGGVRQLPKTPTPFMKKICDIPYPIYDLTKNSKPYLWTEAHIKTLFPTSVIISSLVQTNVKLPINIPISRLECKKHTLFLTKMAKISKIDIL